ncbi:MAG: protein kinase domain-containing protein [Pyrinomonadaceae bacterium]
MRARAGWQQVEDLFHSALAVKEPYRQQLLRARCDGNELLLNEVNALLNAYECDKNTLDESVLELGFAVISEQNKEESLVGRTVLSYTLLEKLGEGGMGTIYLAHDARLNREVALKFISSEYFDSDLLKKRLLREAQAAAKLDHPNICPIYAIEEVDGLNFIVMPCISGQTLAELIKDGHHFSQQDILSIIEQTADAVSAAHAQGIIHRDIKPANIMRDAAGHIQVLDFGLAKLVSPPDQITNGRHSTEDSTGLVFGTVSYMSPEQLRNERLDFRTDIYSLGVLIYELCTLKNPFLRASQADTISSVLNHAIDFKVLDTSPGLFLKPTIQKCLEKKRSDRYTSMDELTLALNAVQHDVTWRIPLSSVRSAGKWISIALLFLLAAFSANVYWSTRSAQVHRVAILPLANKTGDPALDYLGSGISEGLINRLARQTSRADLEVKPFTAVAGYREPALEDASLLTELNADFEVNGTIERVDGRLIATLNAFDNEHSGAIWTSSTPFETDDLLTLEQTVAKHIITTLQVPAHSTDSSSIVHESGEAYRHYLIGQYFWSKRDGDNIQKAIMYFNRAIEIDPSYAKAYAGLANSFVLQSLSAYGAMPTEEAMMKAKAAARQAIEIDPDNCEAHTALGVVLMKYDWNWRDAQSEFEKAISNNPDYAAAHYWNASLMAITGRREQSIAEAKKARELDPFSPLSAVNLARVYYYARQYDDAIEVIRREQESGTSDLKLQYMMGLAYLQEQRYTEARSIFEDIYKQNKLFGSAALGFCYAKMGASKKAHAIISELQANSRERTVPALEIGMIYIALKEKTKACQYLERALSERHSALISLRVEPLYDDVRDTPEFTNLLASMQLIDESLSQ